MTRIWNLIQSFIFWVLSFFDHREEARLHRLDRSTFQLIIKDKIILVFHKIGSDCWQTGLDSKWCKVDLDEVIVQMVLKYKFTRT